jgi:Ser/Thr protein kinase RdoA (MazF antagonist)
MVSTNHVYRLSLAGGHHLVAKVSSYGSYWLFKEDHDRLHRCRQQLHDTRYANLLADTVTKDGRVFVHRDGDLWAALYDEVPTRRSLPRIVSGEDVQNLAEEMARFHQACREVARLVPPTSTSIKSDAIHLLDLLSDPATAGRFPYDRDERATIQVHAERFLEQLDVLGYDDWVKIPVLIDWNLGNFSVDLQHDGSFTLFSRWDYDWFRMEPRLLDFYFLSRVSSRTGDRTHFSYASHTLTEPQFVRFLRAYHAVYPLTEADVRFLPEVYRFFILNYVVLEGARFFRSDFAGRFRRDAARLYLPELDRLDISPLLAILDGG